MLPMCLCQDQGQWKTVAQGVNFDQLQQLIADQKIPSGTRLRAVLDLHVPLGWIFNAAGAELVFQPFMPDSVILDDISGGGSQMMVDMHATAPWLASVRAFIGAYWGEIIIAGLFLTAVIAFVKIDMWVGGSAGSVGGIPVAAIAIVGAIVLGLWYMGSYGKKRGGE